MTPDAISLGEMALLQKKLRLLMELRRAGIGDARVLGAIEKTPREKFVPPAFEDQAYENLALPIGQGQTVSQPYVVALMTEKLELGERHNALEIGTGSGYQTAVLARLCRRVFSVERHRELLRDAERQFGELWLRNIVCRFGDGTKGLARAGALRPCNRDRRGGRGPGNSYRRACTGRSAGCPGR